MREIVKYGEPRSLTRYKAKPDSTYDGPNFTPIKNDIRHQLLAEQGHTCAYCNQRIKFEKMKVEHWASQDGNDDLQLVYSNMLGCCKGGEGLSFKEQTCDTKKGNRDIKYSPANHLHKLNNKISYLSDGTIESSDSEFDSDINKILNLNLERMKSNRSAAIKSIQRLLNHKNGIRNKESIRKLLDKVLERNPDNMLSPFYGIIVYYLSRKL